jgi:hypothetical protein
MSMRAVFAAQKLQINTSSAEQLTEWVHDGLNGSIEWNPHVHLTLPATHLKPKVNQHAYN